MTHFKLWTPAAALLMASASHAGLEGTTFSARWAFPNLASTYPFASATPPSFVVGAGVETIIDVEGVTDVSADFTDNSLTLVLTTILTAPTWNVTAFNGPVFDLTAGGPLDIVSATVGAATTMPGFDSSRIGFDGGRITIDFNGLSYVSGHRVVVNFASAVPEPSSWALMVAGLAILGARRSVQSRARRSPPAPTA
jgi:hypothetical protein